MKKVEVIIRPEKLDEMKEILDAAQKFDVKEYQKSGRGYYGYSEKIKRGA